MLEGLSNPPVFNQSKLIYLQHVESISTTCIFMQGEKKKKKFSLSAAIHL